MKIYLHKTFTDYRDYDVYSGCPGKAAKDFCDFCNAHPFIEVVLVSKRRREIKNCGNGIEFYDIDLIFKADKKMLKEPEGDWEEWELKEELE